MKKITTTSIVLLLGLIGVVMLGHTTTVVSRFSAFLAQKSIALSVIQWGLLSLLAYFWPDLIKFLTKSRTWSLEVESYLIALRWPIVCSLALFELLVMQNTLARCLDFLVH